MLKPVTRRTNPAKQGRCSPFAALQPRGGFAKLSIDPQTRKAHRAWAAAARARKAIQNRITHAFRKHVEGAGPGPADLELQMFARLAVAERRLGRRLARLKLKWCFGNGPRGIGQGPALRRGEQP